MAKDPLPEASRVSRETSSSARTRPRRGPRLAIKSFRLPAALIAIALMLGMSCGRVSAVTIGGPFRLTAPDGRVVTDQTFRGTWLLVYFGYTSCPDTCPITLAEIAKTLQKLGSDADRVRPIFITLDPKRDTPNVLGAYTSSFDPRILGLTGTPDEIDAVVHAYGAYALAHMSGSSEESDLIDHSTYIYLMSPDGSFVRAFDTRWSAAQMAEVLRAVMSPGRQSVLSAQDKSASNDRHVR